MPRIFEAGAMREHRQIIREGSDWHSKERFVRPTIRCGDIPSDEDSLGARRTHAAYHLVLATPLHIVESEMALRNMTDFLVGRNGSEVESTRSR